MALAKLRGLAGYVILRDFPAHSRCMHIQAPNLLLLSRMRVGHAARRHVCTHFFNLFKSTRLSLLPVSKNVRLSSSVAKTQPSSAPDTTPSPSAQLPLDQPPPEELENAGKPSFSVLVGVIDPVYFLCLHRAVDGGRDKSVLRRTCETGKDDGT